MEIPTKTLLELAFSAYRVNQGYEKSTQRFSEGQPARYSNKELVTYSAYYYTQKDTESNFKMWIPEDFVPLTVTNDDREAKAAAEKHMRRYTMLALGKLSDFENDMFTAYSSEVMSVKRVGLVAYLPEFVNRELREKAYQARLKQEFADSKHITEDRIQGNCEILKVIRVSRDFEDTFYMHIGAINGNLVSFCKKEGFAEGAVYTITAKTKAQDQERETNLPMTRINYVKLQKTEA